MSAQVDDYDKAGLVDFVMKGVVTEPDSPIVHEAANQEVLPLPGPPGRRTVVQWVNEKLEVSLMEDDLREYERKILKLWGLQQLYAMTIDTPAKEGFLSRNSLDSAHGESVAERLQRLSLHGKRPTAELTVETSPELLPQPSPRAGTF